MPPRPIRGHVDSCFFDGRALVLVGWLLEESADLVELAVEAGGTRIDLAGRHFRHPRPDVALSLAREGEAAAADLSGLVCLAALPATAFPPAGPTVLLVATADGRSLRIGIEPAADRTALDEMAFADAFAGLPADTVLSVLEQLGIDGPPDALPPPLRARLRMHWRRAVQDLPTCLEDDATPSRMYVDFAMAGPQRGLLAYGWRLLNGCDVRSVHFHRVDDIARDLIAHWTLIERPDVVESLRAQGVFFESDELGFMFHIPWEVQPADAACYLRVGFADGRVRRMKLDMRPYPTDPIAAIRHVLGAFWPTQRNMRAMLDRHVGPVVEAIWNTRTRPAGTVREFGFGTPPARPVASMVVPIHTRFDFIEFQIAQFANDPDMARHELIYVIDDPAIYEAVRPFCIEIGRFYCVPFRVLYQGVSRGFAGATNLGAAAAKGEYVLLLNSDVFPRHPGWLGALVDAHRALPAAGAVAPKLLFEDGSIQHAGIRFAPLDMWGGLWVNDHPLKGQPDPALHGAGPQGPVPMSALTGACLLAEAATFRRLGGLSEDYIIGDFEDTDLCLKMREAGLTNYYIPGVSLYHLERQSQALQGSPHWRTALTAYNCWRHDRRWGTRIAQEAAAEMAG